METNKIDEALDGITVEPVASSETTPTGRKKRKLGPRKKREEKPEEPVFRPVLESHRKVAETISRCVFLITEGFTHLPINATLKPENKEVLDDGLSTILAQIESVEYLKYAPYVQIGAALSLILVDAYEEKRKRLLKAVPTSFTVEGEKP